MSDTPLDLDMSDIPWPDDKTKIFKEGPMMWCLQWNPKTPEQWFVFAEGYREGAELLYKQWKADRERPDYLIFPMVFMYRHHIELRLKEVIQSADEFLRLPRQWRSDHNLVDLWAILLPRLKEIFPDDGKKDLRNAERLVRELSKLDWNSMLFRYPTDKKGNKTTAALERLDVHNFFTAIRQLASFLIGCANAICEYLHERSAWHGE